MACSIRARDLRRLTFSAPLEVKIDIWGVMPYIWGCLRHTGVHDALLDLGQLTFPAPPVLKIHIRGGLQCVTFGALYCTRGRTMSCWTCAPCFFSPFRTENIHLGQLTFGAVCSTRGRTMSCWTCGSSRACIPTAPCFRSLVQSTCHLSVNLSTFRQLVDFQSTR